jgi:hypothetical protein
MTCDAPRLALPSPYLPEHVARRAQHVAADLPDHLAAQEPAGHAVQGLVGRDVGAGSAAPREEVDQPETEDLVPLAGSIAIRIERCQQALERGRRLFVDHVPRPLGPQRHSPWSWNAAQ